MAKQPPKRPDATAIPAADKGEKLHKVLANLGFGSRRKMEQWIEGGRLKLDGKVAKLGDRVRAEQTVRLDDKLIAREPADQSPCVAVPQARERGLLAQ